MPDGTLLVPPTARGSPAKQQTYAYVVYTRSMSLPALVGLLKNYFSQHVYRGVSTLLWLDFLCSDTSTPSADSIAACAAAISEARKTIVALDENADVLTRAWCIFEVFAAAAQASAPPEHWLYVIANAFTGDEQQLVDAVFSISLASLKCTSASDLPALLAAMREVRARTSQIGWGQHIATTVADVLWKVLGARLARVGTASKGEGNTLDTVKVRITVGRQNSRQHMTASALETCSISLQHRSAAHCHKQLLMVCGCGRLGPLDMQAQRLHAIALMHQRKYGRAESRLAAAIQGAHSIHAPRAILNAVAGARSAAGVVSVADGASTVGGSSIMSIDEEAKHLIFSMTLLLARICHLQGKLKEAVRDYTFHCCSPCLACSWSGPAGPVD
jgi:hypothetical protein